ncbi:SMI1/KNR4 family protein [Streptomyces sp. NBC_00963]|uniref:SMI1/KNR4 family protein n=1 Tax=Streptomyces sp. NBC_00963 TaxID=2903697 RepID=UPI00386335C6|nr:SMI1/KNR4 family protein [Streptomyces sp. NBC_00963]
MEQREVIRVTRAVSASKRVIRMVRENEGATNHGDGCDARTLATAERELGLVFPPSYRCLLSEFGTWDIAGTEFIGVYKTSALGDVLLGSVGQTLQARREVGLPHDLIVVMVDDVWAYVVLDASREDHAGEYPVCAWNPGLPDRDSMERVGDDFGSFALKECQRAMGL